MRAARRRAEAAPERGPRRGALLGLLLVVLTVAGLAIAGTTGRPTGRPARPTERVSTAGRTLVCTGGLAKAAAITGSPTSPATAKLGSTPTVVDGTDPLRFAAQTASGSTWLAYAGCPQPRAGWWFVGVGASTLRRTDLVLANPRSGDAVVDVDVFGPKGEVQAPGLHGLSVRSGATRTLDLAKVAPAVGDLAVRVTASRGLVVAGASGTSSAQFGAKPISEWIPADTAPAKSQTLVGLPDKPSAASLLVTNPGQDEAIVTVRAIGAGGTFTPTTKTSVNVDPGAVAALDLRGVFDGKPVAVTVSANVDVVAAVRTVTAGDEAYAVQGSALSGTTTAGLPSSARTTVVVSSVGKAGSVLVRAYDAKGKRLARTTLRVPAASSAEVRLPARAASVAVTTMSPDLLGAIVVQASHGIAAAPLVSPVAASAGVGVAPAG